MDRVFSFLLWPKREARGPWKQGRKKRGSITCLTDRAYEANKMFIIWLCWLFRFWKGGSRVRGTCGYLRTWNWPITAREISQRHNKYLLLVDCEVRTASYGPSFFPSFYGPSAERAGHENKEGKKQGTMICRTNRANDASKMFIIWFCWLFRFWKGDRELEICTATYGPGIDQSQNAKSVSHIIRMNSSGKW